MKYLPIIAVLLLSSCSMQKWCWEHYPVVPDTITIETMRDSIVYRDTLVTVYISSETVVIDSVEIPCPPPLFFRPDTAIAVASFSEARAWFSYPNIILKLTQKDIEIELRIDSAIKEAYYWREKYEQITAVQEVVRIPLVYRIALWMLAGMIFMGVIIALVKRL